MRSLFDAIGVSAHSTSWLTLLLDAAWKGAILLTTALLLSLLLRRAAAATRHLVWSLALFGLLTLPVLSFMLPTWNVPLMPQVLPSSESFERSPVPSQEFRLPKSKSQKIYQLEARSDKTWAVSTNYSRQDPPQQTSLIKTNRLATFSSWTWARWIFVAWLFGVALVALRWLSGWICVKLLSRHSEEILDDEWYDLSESLSAAIGLQKPVKLLRAKKSAAPMTWGLFQPVVLLPNNADTWPAERRHVVLLHELAHVKRGDLISQCVAQIACTLYWFNPLTWIAAHQLRVEREQACDDEVLNTGTKASDYANHILEILRSLRFAKYSPSSAVAMAQCSQIESRLRAILDPNLRRRALTPRSEVLMGAAVACMVLPLAALSPWARLEKAPAQLAGNFILSQKQFQDIDPKSSLGVGQANDPMVIPPWRAGSKETAASPEPAKDCDEKKPDLSVKTLKLDQLVENGANAVGQNLVAAIHSLGIEKLPGEQLVGETAEKLGKVLAEKLRDSGYDEVSINDFVHRVNDGVDEEYVQEVKKAGYPNLSIEELLEMRIYGVDADYIRAMKEAGFDNLSVEELIQLRIQGVDAEYAKAMRAAYGNLSVDELLQLRIQGVDAEYAEAMNAAGFGELPIEELLQLRIQGVDAEYAKEMKAAYGDLSLEELLQLRIQGVDTDYAKAMKAAGFGELPINELLQLRIQGVDAEYAQAMKAAYPDISANELLQLRIQGVDADFAKEMKAAGFGDLTINDLLQLRIQGVDADYAKGMKDAGFADLSTNDLLQLRIQGVDADYVKELKMVGYDKLTTEQILQMRIQGVDADFVKELQGVGLKNLSPEKLIQMKIHGFDARFFKE